MDSHHKGPVTREMFPFDDVIMLYVTRSIKYFNSIALTSILKSRILFTCPKFGLNNE